MNGEITEKINELNQKGIEICAAIESGKPGNYSDAIALFEDAIAQADEHKGKINPDYKTVSVAKRGMR